MSGHHPGILIESLHRRSRSSEDRAHAPTIHDLNVSQVSQDFGDRPFVRRGALAQFRRRDAFDKASKLLRCCGLDFDWILSLCVVQDSLLVLLNGFRHLKSPNPDLRYSPAMIIAWQELRWEGFNNR